MTDFFGKSMKEIAAKHEELMRLAAEERRAQEMAKRQVQSKQEAPRVRTIDHSVSPVLTQVRMPNGMVICWTLMPHGLHLAGSVKASQITSGGIRQSQISTGISVGVKDYRVGDPIEWRMP